jgi:hypothetical protein
LDKASAAYGLSRKENQVNINLCCQPAEDWIDHEQARATDLPATDHYCGY